MKLNQSHIAAIVSAAKGAASKSTMPILECVAIENSPSGFVAYGQYAVVQVKRTAESLPEAFSCAVSADKIIKALGNADEADLKITGGKLVLKVGRSRYTLAIMEFDLFPTMTFEPEASVKITGATVATLKRAAPFAAKEDVRYYLKGVFWSGNTVVGTNGHQLAVVENEPTDDHPEMIIPAESLSALDVGEWESVNFSAQGVEFIAPGMSVCIRKIDGKFPDWNRVMPPSEGAPIHIDTASLSAAVDRVALASDKNFAAGRFVFEGNTCSINARDAGGNEADAECDCECTGRGYESGFNINYVKLACKALNGKATIYATDRSMLMQVENMRVVIMPMRD